MNKNDGKFYVFQKKEEPRPSRAKLALFIVITVMWLAGMVCLFMRLTDAGIILWGASFLTALVVYFIQRHRQSLAELQEAEMLADAKPLDGEGDTGAKETQAESQTDGGR